MKIIIFGATGGTGRKIVQRALGAGHEVTAIVREPAEMKISHDRLHILRGDALNEQSFANALAHQEGVISALGIAGLLNSLRPMTFHRKTAENIVLAMQAAGVMRFIGISSVGVLRKPVGPLWYRLTLKPLIHNKYEDMRQMEKVIRASPLDWTVVRPFRLTDGAQTGLYRIGATGEISNAGAISRADVADFIVTALQDHKYFGKAVALAY